MTMLDRDSLIAELTEQSMMARNWWPMEPDIVHVAKQQPHGYYTERNFTKNELDSVTPDLYPALQGLFAWMKKHEGRSDISSGNIIGTVKLLTGSMRTFVLDNNNEIHTGDIQCLVVAEDSNSKLIDVCLTGVMYGLSHVVHEGRRIPFTTSSTYTTLQLSIPVLDKEYPGWLNRYRVAQELGLSESETVALVVPKPTANNLFIRMDDIKFD